MLYYILWYLVGVVCWAIFTTHLNYINEQKFTYGDLFMVCTMGFFGPIVLLAFSIIGIFIGMAKIADLAIWDTPLWGKEK